MIVYLKNGEACEVANGSSAYDVACKIGIQKKVLAANVNSNITDLTTTLVDKDTITLLTYQDAEGLETLRHSTAHVMAKALIDCIDKDAKLAIGPSIENGFYYDMMLNRTLTIEDLPKIEARMKEIVKQDLPFEKSVIPKAEALDYFKSHGQKYKVELIEGIEEDTVSIYRLGDFVDLCRGPHVLSTKYIPIDAIKLTSVAGAYWRGNNKNDMLQRIYGTVFPTQKETDAYFKMLKEAQARDHRKLGVELDIFHLDDVAPGNVFWLKNGTIIFNLIKDYITKVIRRHNYFVVQTPQLMDKSLWETSGHWGKFKENMFIVEDEDTTMAIKPMNCPGHIICYQTGAVKSYRDMPIRMAEFGLCHRNESSGSLHGIMRLRAFMQDDAHVFCTPEQIVSETIDICAILKEIYGKFGFHDIKVKFSDRPEKRIGSDEVWDLAEKSLTDAAHAAGLEYTLNRGEGAFYGPKLEFVLKDCLGRDWQCGTLQVDFNLPQRFGIHYIDKDGNRQTPVMIHRAIVGSIERFIGILIEHYAGKFPFWLAPTQIAVASVTEGSAPYANKVAQMLTDANYRVLLDTENEKITYKIREHSVKKIPAIVIIGNKESNEETISIRCLGYETTKTIALSEMLPYFEQLECQLQTQ